MKSNMILNDQLKRFSVLEDITVMMEEEVVPILGGGLSSSAYVSALVILLNIKSGSSDLVPVNLHPSFDVKFKGLVVGFASTSMTVGEVGITILSNSAIVEKDIQEAKRVIRFSSQVSVVMICNIDWWGNISYEIVTV